MVNMLVKGANDQFNYMKNANDYMDLNTYEDEKTFVDI